MTSEREIKSVLGYIENHFTRDSWENDETVQTEYERCLFHKIPQSDIGNYLDKLLPPALLLADHHDLERRLFGVKCLDYIMTGTSRTELVWYGRAEVILDCLLRAMYTHEATLVEALHPCLLKVLTATDPHPKQDVAKPTHYDEILQRLIRDMEMEDKLAVRLAYSRVLPLYNNKLGLLMLKHIQAYLRMTFSYLEVYDGPHEETRLNILSSLKSVLQECWPRIPAHSEKIIKGLSRLIYDICTDRTQTPDEVKRKVNQSAVDCLILVRRASPDKAGLLLRALRELDLDKQWSQCINTVLTAD